MIRSGEFKGFIQTVMDQDIDGVTYYISLGMDVNFLHPEIMTNPLIEATKLENVPIIKLLLQHHADPTIVSQLGESAMGLAIANENEELIALFGGRKNQRSRFINFWKKSFNAFFPSSRASSSSSKAKASS